MEAIHSRDTFIPPPFPLSHQRPDTFTFRSCCKAHLPFSWMLGEDQGVKAAAWETGTLELLLSAGLVLARDDRVGEAGLLSQPCSENQRNCCKVWSSMED